MVVGLVTVFVIAVRLDPYRGDGAARRMETHRQLGLPPCSFLEVTGVPCPSCGMTTSFALLMHADVLGSLRANCVGTLLALFCLCLIPWAVLSVARGRALLVRDLERATVVVIMALLILMTLRWGIVVGWGWLSGTPLRL
jgi:hypothetical protein